MKGKTLHNCKHNDFDKTMIGDLLQQIIAIISFPHKPVIFKPPGDAYYYTTCSLLTSDLFFFYHILFFIELLVIFYISVTLASLPKKNVLFVQEIYLFESSLIYTLSIGSLSIEVLIINQIF